MKSVLVQAYPNLGTFTLIYIVPEKTRFSTFAAVNVANTSSSDATYRISVVPPNESPGPNHQLFWDAPLCAKQTTNAQPGITLPAAGWRVYVYSSSGTVSFNLSFFEL